MNCITVMEPHATALILGLQKFENRTFRIKEGKCAIHISTKCSYPPKRLYSYYESIGAKITADICRIIFNGETETENVILKDGCIEHIKEFDANSADAKLASTLFERNASSNNGSIFLTSQIIGHVEFTHNEQLDKREFANYYKNGVLYSLKDSIFVKGQLGQFTIDKE